MTRTLNKTQTQATRQEAKIEQLLDEFYPYIHRFAFSILDDLHEADDVAQETFIAAHHALAGFRNEANLKTWLSSIAINACRGKLRSRKVREVLNNTLRALHLLKTAPFSPEQAAIQNEADRSIWQAVAELDDKHRIPIILHYVHELDVPEVARILHISQGTVHSRLHYARRKLHGQLWHLDPHQEEPREANRKL